MSTDGLKPTPQVGETWYLVRWGEIVSVTVQKVTAKQVVTSSKFGRKGFSNDTVRMGDFVVRYFPSWRAARDGYLAQLDRDIGKAQQELADLIAHAAAVRATPEGGSWEIPL